ncbi:cytochrome P450 [Streptomyces sp. NPDC005827]|uniref:cytochrome P450 n=1 Tax=Streptomyces sp. NPDC005827 TaxID=3157070 RepID=UPI00340D3C29
MTTAEPTTGNAEQPAAIDFPLPKASGCPFDPPPGLADPQSTEEITRVRLWDGSSPWLITGHQYVRELLQDSRISADALNPGFPFLVAGVRELVRSMKPTMFRQDNPEHARLRRMLTSDFMVKSAEAMRPDIQRHTDELLDRMADGRSSADLVAEFALPLPSTVICLMLGVPYEDHSFFEERSTTLFSITATAEEVRASQYDLLRYMEDIARAKKEKPDDSIISRLVARGDLEYDEIASTARLLVIAGHETTANMIALSTLALLRNPDQLARLRDDPSLITGGVEELLRYLTIVHNGIPRVAASDIEIGGRVIKAGDGVLCMINTANRDERAFPDGHTLDVGRNARRHVAFGFGPHQCLGQPLARVELQIALGTLLRRLPKLRLDCSFDDIPLRQSTTVYGIGALPVAW